MHRWQSGGERERVDAIPVHEQHWNSLNVHGLGTALECLESRVNILILSNFKDKGFKAEAMSCNRSLAGNANAVAKRLDRLEGRDGSL